MNRIGWTVLAGILLVAALFASTLSFGSGVRVERALEEVFGA